MGALREHADLLAISFVRQYPSWLFPGQSDREPNAAPLDLPDCHYLIDSLNPMSWRRAAGTIRAYGPDLLIIPWWTVYWAPCFWYLAHRCRKSGVEVRFLCHNVLDHEASTWKTAVTKAVLEQGDSFIVQSQQQRMALTTLLPGSRIQVHAHPLYDQFPQFEGELPERRDLELLFYGFVRHYKGLDTLLEALALVRHQGLRLTVAGEFWDDVSETRARIRGLGLEDKVELIPGYVSDEATAAYFARADALVLPYRSGTGSGVLAIAYHYAKPVIATAIGAFRELVRQNETGFLVAPESPQALAGAIDGLSREGAASMAPAIRAFARTMTWDSLAQRLLEA